MKEEFIVIKKSKLKNWFYALNMSGQNTKLSVAREINDLIEESEKTKIEEEELQNK